MEDNRRAFKFLTVKSTGKRPLRRPRRRWKDNIKINIRKIGVKTRYWIDSAQDRDYWRVLVNAILDLRVP